MTSQSGPIKRQRSKTKEQPSPPPRNWKRIFSRLALLCVLFALVTAAALAYPIAARGWEWLGVTWRYPWALLLLLLVPVVLWRGTFAEDARTPRVRLGMVRPLVKGPQGWRTWLRDLPGIMRAVAVALIAVSPRATDLPDASRVDRRARHRHRAGARPVRLHASRHGRACRRSAQAPQHQRSSTHAPGHGQDRHPGLHLEARNRPHRRGGLWQGSLRAFSSHPRLSAARHPGGEK